jgi:lambda family phage portal protein
VSARKQVRAAPGAKPSAAGSLLQRLTERVAGAVKHVFLGRGLEAAGGGRRWPTNSTARNPAAVARAGAETVGARATYYAMNNAHGANIIETIASAILGEAGPRPLPQHPKPIVNRSLRRRFARWAASAGVNGEHLADVLRLALNAMMTSGDGFIALQTDDEDQLRLVVLDSEQVDRAKTVELEGGRRIVEGVELDAAGRVAAFWVFPDRPSAPFMHAFQSERIEASEILHLFRPTVPGQVRGLSILAPVLTKLAEVDSIEDALLARLRVSALMCAFIVDPDGAAGFEGDERDGILETGMEPGAMKVLRPGQSIETPNLPTVNDGNEFLKSQLRGVAAGVGIAYEQLSGDLSGVNYSSIRTGLLEHRRRIGALRRQTIEPRVLDPLWRRWVTLEVLSGRLDAADFEMASEDYFDVEWVWPAWGMIDATKETDAEISAINAGLKSRREVIAASGRDADAVAEDIAAEPPLPTAPAKQPATESAEQ